MNIEPLDVLGVMDAIEAHYQKLDDFGKWCISKSIKCLEIQDKQTLLTRAAVAMKRQGVAVSDTDLKAIYLYSAYMVYGVDGFQGMTREWPNKSELNYVDCTDHYEFIKSIHGDFGDEETETKSLSERPSEDGRQRNQFYK